MNKVNVQKAIDIMKRAGKIDMRKWQEKNDKNEICSTEETLHSCGTAACLAGWIAVSEEWKSDGGYHCLNGSPYINAHGSLYDPHDGIKTEAEAIGYWLDIPFLEASKLCATYYSVEYYGVPDEFITKEMVIEKLEGFLEKDNLFCYI